VTPHITTRDRPAASATDLWAADGKKPASRLRGTKRRRNVPYLLLGVLLVLTCTSTFLLVSLNSGNRRSVLALGRPVAIGQVLTARDLKQVTVAIDDPEVSVVDANQAVSVVGKTLSASLPAGALLTPDAVGGVGVPPTGQAIAALLLKAGQFPVEVSPGAHVSVVFVPGQAGAALASPPTLDSTTVWSAVVTSVTSPPNQQGTVVSVQLSQAAARQIAAVPAGQLSIVMLPGSGQ
jgi:hypothetical protein